MREVGSPLVMLLKLKAIVGAAKLARVTVERRRESCMSARGFYYPKVVMMMRMRCDGVDRSE